MAHPSPAPAHGHGHHNDRGWRGVLRYARLAPKLWSSPMNRAAIAALDIGPADHALDIGAGMGAGTAAAARAGAQVVAVEPTPFLRRVLKVRRLGQRGRVRASRSAMARLSISRLRTRASMPRGR